jgi:hypothetical protein
MCGEQLENKIELDKPSDTVYTHIRCMGRPPKPDHLRRSKLFPLRLTPVEIARYERAARKLGVTVAEVLREGADLYIQMRSKGGSPKKEEVRK